MDTLSTQLAAYIIDAGTHAEFIFKDNVSKVIQTTAPSGLAVNANALIFTLGTMVDDVTALEFILCIKPDIKKKLFSFSNSCIYSKTQLHIMEGRGPSKSAVPAASDYRILYRRLFGFDGATLDVSKILTQDSSMFEDDTQSTRLSGVLVGDSSINSAMVAAGIVFVAVREVDVSGNVNEPKPVFWANGHYTKAATDDNERMFSREITVANTHLQTRFLNSLFGNAEGFCPYLKV
jgi:hypothetical protein